MTTEQKEAIDRLNFHKDFAQIPNNCAIVNVDDIEIVLQIIENSIPKEEVEKYYEYSMYGNMEKDETVRLADCINYIACKLKLKEDKRC